MSDTVTMTLRRTTVKTFMELLMQVPMAYSVSAPIVKELQEQADISDAYERGEAERAKQPKSKAEDPPQTL